MNKRKYYHFGERWKALLEILTEADKERQVHVPLQDYDPFIKTFREYCHPKEYPRIIDLGMGSGTELAGLADQGYREIVGINYNERIHSINEMRFHKATGTTITLLNYFDMHRLSDIFTEVISYPYYDAIFCLQTLEHALSPFLAILEMRAVLRDGGRVYLDLPDSRDEAMLRTLQHTSVLNEMQWEALFIKAGFYLIKNLSVKHRLGFVFEKIPDQIFFKEYPALRKYFRLD